MKNDDDRDLERKLDELAEFSEEIAGEEGRLLHWLHLELIRPGTGVWFQAGPADDADDGAGGEGAREGEGEGEGEAAPGEPELPPWPGAGETDPLEEPFGQDADGIRLISERELEELRRGGDVTGTRPRPDLTKPGSLGGLKPSLPSRQWRSRITHHMRDGTWRRIGPGPADCGTLWILKLVHPEHVPACAGLNYARVYRATLLRAIAEAYRNCRMADPDCPNARVWMLRAHWTCVTRHAGGPLLIVQFKLAVACVAN